MSFVHRAIRRGYRMERAFAVGSSAGYSTRLPIWRDDDNSSIMQPILTPNELLQRSPPPAARDSTETDASVTSPLRQNAAADSFHAAGGAVDGNIHSLLQSDRSTLEECARFFKSVVAGSLLEAGAAAEETARVQKVKSHWLPCAKRLPSLPFCALGAGLRPHNQPLCQVPARRRPRVSRDAASRPGQKWTSTAHGR